MNSSPIQTALCSFGMSGRVFHAPFLHINSGFNLYGVWERSTKAVHEFYSEVKSFDTLEEMLSDENIELVVINTPNVTHYEYAKKALLAGKHIIVEKPFVVSSQQGQELIELAEKQQRKISVYHNRRCDSDYTLLKRVVDEKLIGEVVEAEFHFDRYKEELSPKVHKEIPGQGTGTLYDLGSHLIDQALHLFGKPDAVFADIAIMRPISQVDDYFELLLYFPNKRVRLKASYLVKEALPAYILHGSKGSFIKSRGDVQENDLLAGKKPGSEKWGKEPDHTKGLLRTQRNGIEVRELLVAPHGNYMDYFKKVYKAIRLGEQMPVTAQEGIEVIKIIEAAFKSSAERRVIDL